VIYAGVNGYLDKLPVNQVREFETGLLSMLRSEHMSLLDAIRTEGQLTDQIRADLKAALDRYAKNFA
jgi:F-type H+-transporting ATPase subunit alpha